MPAHHFLSEPWLASCPLVYFRHLLSSNNIPPHVTNLPAVHYLQTNYGLASGLELSRLGLPSWDVSRPCFRSLGLGSRMSGSLTGLEALRSYWFVLKSQCTCEQHLFHKRPVFWTSFTAEPEKVLIKRCSDRWFISWTLFWIHVMCSYDMLPFTPVMRLWKETCKILRQMSFCMAVLEFVKFVSFCTVHDVW